MNIKTKQQCLPCQIPEFDRNIYYTGKLLTARDLSDEQLYFRNKLRLHHIALHGWGVVCGLRVKPHPYCPKLKIVIEEGFAIDDCGREIRVLQTAEHDLPPAPPKHPQKPHGAYGGYGYEEKEEPHEKKLYVCLHYKECETEQMPAPFDECGCNGNGNHAGRAVERWEIEITDKKPEYLKDNDDCDDNCDELYWRQPDCPQPGKHTCVLLAVIHRFVPGLDVNEDMIDMRRRPMLRSTHQLDTLIRCLIEKLPTRRLTHICSFNWTHGNEVHCHDFMRQYIGGGKAFEIEFDGPVFPEGINARTFQAVVVHGKPGAGRRSEIAPAKIDVDRQKCSLKIEHDYAQQNLKDRDFDLFLTLKCDVIVDESGLAVDGNLLARLLDDEGHKQYAVITPTGDGVPGGLFESWIKVRTHVPAS